MMGSAGVREFTLFSLSSDAVWEVTLPCGDVTFGRDAVSDVHFADAAETLSRRHCTVRRRGAFVDVEDHSRNGTFVNGRRVGRGRSLALRRGDVLSLVNPILPECGAFSFRFGCAADCSSALLADRYALGRVLGTGGAACVRAGSDLRTGEAFAVKLVTAPTVFAAEVDALRALQPHPHIVRFIAAVAEPPALVLERCCGGDLFEYVAQRPGRFLSEKEAQVIFAQLLDAVRHVHRSGLLHGDVTPQNVLLTEQSKESVVAKLADFGSARRLCDKGNRKAQGITAVFAAPEVRAGKDGGVKADVYSLGALLRYMCGEDASQKSLECRDLLEAMLSEKPEKRPGLDAVAKHPWLADRQKRRRSEPLSKRRREEVHE